MPALTPNEEAQLAQTIEMFEVITQSQPQDYQSLEILKEAYFKLGRQKEVVNTSKRIAEAYVQLGQLSSAILEYESILQRFPDDPDVRKALVELESKANSFAAAPAPMEAEYVEKAASSTNKPVAKSLEMVEDGRAAMHKLLVEGKLLSASDFNQFWLTPDTQAPPIGVTEPFLQTLAEKAILPLDKSIKLVCERSRVSYLPIERYDVDIELARSFPREVCLRWAILPFDRMSKSVLVATANPFNKQAARDLEAATKNRLLWYVVSPAELVKLIRKIYR